MTRRRDLEQAVINAARKVIDEAMGDGYFGDPQLFDTTWMDRLRTALAELDKLRDVEKPRANRVAPITSHQAAEWVSNNTQRTMLHKVFYRVYWFSRNDWQGQYGGGATVDELIDGGTGPHQTVSARVNELANAGWIVDSGRTRKTRTGRDAVVWVPSPAARQAVEDGNRPT